jgi:integrase/recombinase XerD
MQLDEVLKEFIFELEIKKFSKRTIKSYRNNNALFFNFLKNEFGVSELEDLTGLHIKRYFQHLTKKGLKPTYINSILKNIRAFCVYCIEEGYIKNNPAEKVKWQREGKVLINTFTSEEIINMLNAFKFTTYLEARNKTILANLIDTGIRNAELCDIKNEDVKDKVILIHGKGSKQRQVSISPLMKKYMIRYERIRSEYFKNYNLKHDNYYISYRGEPLTIEAIERVVRIAGKRANVRSEIRCSPHTIRHWYSQEQLRNGLDTYSLSRLLGHENITITKRYLQSINDEDIVDLSIKTSPLMNLKGGKR